MGQVVGGGLGLLGGLFANQQEGSRDAGNVYAQDAAGTKVTQDRARSLLDPNAAAQGVTSNSVLGGLLGGESSNSTLQQTQQQESDQANQPWALTDQDKSAYGQISGDIARQYGQSDQSLAQALSNRGMSNSGVAGAAFSGAQGSKLEQLAQTQQQIAQQRFNSNLQRLGQTQQFLSQLGGQAQGAIGQQLGVQQNNIGNAQNLLAAQQNQSNQNLAQQQQTAHAGSLSNAFSGALSGMAAMNGGGGGQKMGGQAGESMLSGGVFA